MNRRRIMIAAPKSGSGKTVVTCALLQALKDGGWQVVSCKCGPDYIDPMFHEKVIGVPARNLDTFFTDEEQTRRLFLKNRGDDDFAVLEGVMGLYDGLGGVRREGSSYHLACVTKTPILLVADVKGMGRSIIPLLAGFLKYDTEHLIRGVILNRISGGYCEIIKPLIEEELQIPVAGFLPEKEELHIQSRHLGLFMPDEMADIGEKLRAASEELQKTVSVETIVRIAESAEEICTGTEAGRDAETGEKAEADGRNAKGGDFPADDSVIIAVARDEAFCFYYEDNLALLKESGAKITYFSPMRDEALPEGCHGLLFGGGYPELYAESLSENVKMRRAVREASENGMPIVAECGGFLYLHSTMTDQEGNRYQMAGVVMADCYHTGRSVRFGYVELREKRHFFLPENTVIKGHEFHYYDSTYDGEDAVAVKPVTGRNYPCVVIDETHWMGFPHLYYPSNPVFVKSFVKKAGRYRERMETE